MDESEKQWVGRAEPAGAGGPFVSRVANGSLLTLSMHVVHKTRGFPFQLGKIWRGRMVWHTLLSFSLSNTPFLLSRKYLTQLHSTPTDSNAADALVTTYHTLSFRPPFPSGPQSILFRHPHLPRS